MNHIHFASQSTVPNMEVMKSMMSPTKTRPTIRRIPASEAALAAKEREALREEAKRVEREAALVAQQLREEKKVNLFLDAVQDGLRRCER